MLIEETFFFFERCFLPLSTEGISQGRQHPQGSPGPMASPRPTQGQEPPGLPPVWSHKGLVTGFLLVCADGEKEHVLSFHVVSLSWKLHGQPEEENGKEK